MKPLTHFSACVCLILSVSVVSRAQKPELVVQTGHSNFVSAVAFSPDGKMLASGARYPNRTIQLWDVATGIELRSLAGHADDINALVFSPDSKILASASGGANLESGEQTIKLWDVASGKLLDTLGGNYPVFSPDGKTLAHARERIKLWSITGHREEKTIDGDYPLGFGSHGAAIIGLGEGKIKSWDVRTGAELYSFPALDGDPRQIFWHRFVISNDGKLVAVATEGPSIGHSVIKIWNVLTGRIQAIVGGGPIAFTPDGKGLACGTGLGEDGSIKLWDLASGEQVRTLIVATNQQGQGISIVDSTALRRTMRFVGPSKLHGNLAFSPDGHTIASGIGYGAVGLWDTSNGKARPALFGHAVTIPSLAFTHDGRTLATGSGGELWANNAVKLWDLSNNGGMRALIGHNNSVNSVVFSPDDKILASGGSDQEVKLWNAGSGAAIDTLVRESNVNALAFSPDGKLLAAGRGGVTGNPFNMGVQVREYSEQTNLIDIWEISTGRFVLLRTLPAQRSMVHAVAFSPDSNVLMSGTGYSSMETTLWKVSTGEKILTISGLGRAFSPDSGLLAIESESDQTIELHDARTGKLVRSFKGSQAPAAFGRDGKILAVAGENNSISIYEVASGARLQVFEAQTNTIEALAFTPDGQVLASNAGVRTKLWQVGTGRELATLIALGKDDWLVVTPQGLFDGSPGAWRQLFWRFDNNTFNHAPVEAFFKEFYYPGLLQEIMQGKRPPLPKRDLSQIDIRQPDVKIIGVDNRPPTTQSQPSMTKRTATVKVEVTDNTKQPSRQNFPATGGAQDLRLFRNGSLVKLWEKNIFELGERDGCRQIPGTKDSPRRAICETEVKITADKNEFTAYAFNHDDVKSIDDSRIVTGEGNLKRAGSLYVLTVGIGQYANPNYNLNYTPADAQDFGDEMRHQQELLHRAKQGRYEHIKVIPLLDQEATKANILLALDRLSSAKTGKLPEGTPPALAEFQPSQPEDGVIVYFSGHGTAQKDRFYLIPHDIGYMGSRKNVSDQGLQTILSHSISDVELEKAFRGIDAGELLLVIDACNSGQALEAEEKRRGPMNTKGLAQLAYEKGMYVLTASQSVELAYESEALKHSYMTYALIEEGLKSRVKEADANGDGQVWLREWFDYAVQRVPRMREEKIEQTAKRQNKSLDLVEVAEQGKVQTPRVFYRREADSQPWVIAQSK